ncbi:hypothetical protein CJU94_18885 [Paraburkholderia aromaticivorans]|uniref:Uncharacterized protein n=2 Tax=Paraburkholderia aromaticivorans TaxID=2026199 RepID=A0A248VM16_9BURK|nr:hypothetical protein CJU94_18885 [Paraburkholderia aromaticivorans]
MYGKPLVSASSGAAAHAQLVAVARAASTPAAGASDAQATVQTLQDALAARGVTANVTAQVMDGTTLHQIVMGVDNGLPPTPDQFKTDPSEWMVVNFQLDDMVTPATDPAQRLAIQQFVQDLTVFAQRAAVSGKAVFAVNPIPTCDTEFSAARGLSSAMTEASTNGAPLRFIGEYGVAFLFGGPKVVAIASSPGIEHFGSDCRTPDAYIQNIQIQSIADTIAEGYKEAAATPSAASGASVSGM